LYKLIFRKAVGDANDIYNENHHSFWNILRGKDAILYTLWDRLEVPPIAPYADFFIPNSLSG
jgi:anoctamin-10